MKPICKVLSLCLRRFFSDSTLYALLVDCTEPFLGLLIWAVSGAYDKVFARKLRELAGPHEGFLFINTHRKQPEIYGCRGGGSRIELFHSWVYRENHWKVCRGLQMSSCYLNSYRTQTGRGREKEYSFLDVGSRIFYGLLTGNGRETSYYWFRSNSVEKN